MSQWTKYETCISIHIVSQSVLYIHIMSQ